MPDPLIKTTPRSGQCAMLLMLVMLAMSAYADVAEFGLSTDAPGHGAEQQCSMPELLPAVHHDLRSITVIVGTVYYSRCIGGFYQLVVATERHVAVDHVGDQYSV